MTEMVKIKAKAQIIEWLGCKAQRSHQILHGQGLPQPQTIDPGNRHAFGIELGNHLRGEIGPAAHQHHDVTRPSVAPLALFEHQRLVFGMARINPAAHLFGDILRQPRFMRGQPVATLFAFGSLLRILALSR